MDKVVIPFKENDKARVKQEILYDDNEFLVAIGEDRDDDIIKIGARWKVSRSEDDAKNAKGYPSVFNNPCWFIISDKLEIDFLKSLIGKDGADSQAICRAIEILQTKEV